MSFLKNKSFFQKTINTKKIEEEQFNLQLTFSLDINKNEKQLKEQLDLSEDVIFHHFVISLHNGTPLKACRNSPIND